MKELGYQYRRQEDRLTSMGRHLRRKVSDVGFEEYRPGCKNPRTVSFDLYTDEAQEYLSAKAVPFPVEQQAIRTSSTNRITRKAQIKALISKEIFARTRLQQRQ
uniref:Uncharacterized protein n=1 Tax=Salix viminalis TaxID=40686 RepID=A0A6N2LHJ3_SALVM